MKSTLYTLFVTLLLTLGLTACNDYGQEDTTGAGGEQGTEQQEETTQPEQSPAPGEQPGTGEQEDMGEPGMEEPGMDMQEDGTGMEEPGMEMDHMEQQQEEDTDMQ